MNNVTQLWAAQETGIELTAELDHAGDNWYQLTLENGPFSGYPTINLTTDDLQRLHATLTAHLGAVTP